MELSELLTRLRELAHELGLEVRDVRGSEGDPPLASGVCRVRERTWVMLSSADDLDHRVEVLARALAKHAGAQLEGRYLPPAVRARLSRERDPG